MYFEELFYIALGCLPFVGLFLTIFCFVKSSAYKFSAVVCGSIVWGGCVAIVTNILSFFNLLYFLPILVFWVMYIAVAGYFLKTNGFPSFYMPQKTVLGFALVFIALIIFVSAIAYPPSTWDSMTYHLPKVMQWLQNKNLAHFYTSNVRQTGLVPFAEIIIFHTYALSGADYLANLVQYSAFIGVLMVSMSIASLLGAEKRGQLFAAIFFATLPMAIAQASSTQTDMVVAFWLCCLVNIFIVWRQNPSAINAIYFGVALGVAILTKGTAYVVGFPFVLAFSIYSLLNYKKLFVKAALAGIMAASIFFPHLIKNYYEYGDVLAGSLGANVTKPNLNTLIVNVYGNILVNAPVIFGKEYIDSISEKFAIYLDPDRNAFFPYSRSFTARSGFSFHEDVAQNPFHLALFIICLTGFGFVYSGKIRAYRLYILASSLLFCLLIAWQPWLTRLQVPLFALAAPLVGVGLERMGHKIFVNIIIAVLLFTCTVPLLFNPSRPIANYTLKKNPIEFHFLRKTRDELYFVNRRDLISDYFKIVTLLADKRPNSIGLIIGGDSWEYPLWALLRSKLGYFPVITHVSAQERQQFFQKGTTSSTFDFLFFAEIDAATDGSAPASSPELLVRNGDTYQKCVELQK